MNKDYKTDNEQAHDDFERAAKIAQQEKDPRALQEVLDRMDMKKNKKETEEDLKRLDDAAHALKKRHAADDEKRTAVVSHEAHIDLEARVTRLEEAVRLASPEAAAHLDKK